ncbi:MAG: basic amino acid ABC transporter substrate-binding protein [Clostridiales bacterium]|nr:basic amino acid ABC transporter substrate-binding protein [Clostridiales bacterium]
MKKLRKALAVFTAASLIAVMATACGSNNDKMNPGSSSGGSNYNLVSDGKLIMGTNAEFPPFEYKEGSSVVGVDAGVLDLVAKKLGLTLEIKDMTFESLPEALAGRNIDLIAAGFTIKPEREETMDFTDTYYTARQTILLKSDSAYTSAEEMKGKNLKIGVQTGTTGMNDAAPTLTGEDNIVGFNNGALAVEALLSGRVDAVIIDNNPANEYKDQHGDELKLLENQFEEEQYAIAVRKGNKELLDAVNQALRDIKADGSFQKVVDQYVR